MGKKSEMPVNHVMLAWARTSLGFSTQEAAKKLDFDLARLERLEGGEELPSYSQLRKIGTLYKRSTGVFFLEEPPIEPGPPKDFRVLSGKATLRLAPSTLVSIRSMHRRRMQALELLEDSGSPVPKFTSSVLLSDDPESQAELWRSNFGVSETKRFGDEYDALRTWRTAVENLGVLVFQESLESLEELRGLAIYSPLLPMIMTNSKDSVRGRVFSLLHEFCHLLLKTSGIGNMSAVDRSRSNESEIEIFCNAFAGACMVPRRLLLNDPAVARSDFSRPISTADLIRLSNRFQASGEVVLRRLLTFGKINQKDYERYRDRIEEHFKNRKKVRSKPIVIPVPVKVIARNGRPYTELVLDGLQAGIVTEARAARYLGVGLRHIPAIKKALMGPGDGTSA